MLKPNPTFMLVTAVFLAWAPRCHAQPDEGLSASVVKIHSTALLPDYYRPWTSRQPRRSTGSGVVIDGNRILTNAHVVRYAEEVLVQSPKLGRKIPAKVEMISTGIDLAILSVDSDEFFELHPPVELRDTVPDDGDRVTVLGYPMGGDSLSTTEGVVSRVEYTDFYYGVLGLRVQIDAAVNPGNSGGPAFLDGQCIGVVFSGITEADNIGYVIPTAEIAIFLDDIEDGAVGSKPVLDARFMPAENPSLRDFLNVPLTAGGVVVTWVGPTEEEGLRVMDVVIEIEGRPLDDQGQIDALGRRIDFRYAADGADDNTVDMVVIRDGERAEISHPLGHGEPKLLSFLGEERPEYFLIGPLCFTEATLDFARLTEMSAWAPYLQHRESPLVTRYVDSKRDPDEALVVLACPPLSHPVGRGYDDAEIGIALKSVNGVEILNLAHLVQVLRDSEDAYVNFQFVDETDINVLVFDREALEGATEEVLDRHSIRSRMSPAMAEVWEGGE